MLATLSILLVAMTALLGQPTLGSAADAGTASPQTGTVSIRAALVDDEMRARPVPLHGLRLTSADGDTISARTDVNGDVTIVVPAGKYTDLKNSKKLRCIELPAESVAQASNDFERFCAEKRPGAGFRRADPKAAKKRPSARANGPLKDECSWPAQSVY